MDTKENKGDAPKKEEYTFKVDFSVGVGKKGKPKKIYEKGSKHELDKATADYLISKNVIK